MRSIAHNNIGIRFPIFIAHQVSLLDAVDAEREPVIDDILHNLARHLARERYHARSRDNRLQPACLTVRDGSALQGVAILRRAIHARPFSIAARRERLLRPVQVLPERLWRNFVNDDVRQPSAILSCRPLLVALERPAQMMFAIAPNVVGHARPTRLAADKVLLLAVHGERQVVIGMTLHHRLARALPVERYATGIRDHRLHPHRRIIHRCELQ